MMYMVKFDPISEKEYENHRDPGEPMRPPEKRVGELPINEKSLLYRVGGGTVKAKMAGLSHYHDIEVTSGLWQEACQGVGELVSIIWEVKPTRNLLKFHIKRHKYSSI